jgi:hypothetical protein
LYHRAKINLENKNPLLLLRAGIALDHGNMAIGRFFESDFSEQELSIIQKLGFEYTISIRDVVTYYSNADRPSELTQLHSINRNNHCENLSFDYKTPNEYFEGSMGGYFTYEEMLIILELMQLKFPNIISKLDTIDGFKTHNGNSIVYIKVSDNPSTDETEPEVLYTALHHAREPNSLSQMIFYLWYLLENYNSNPEIKYLVDNTEMYFVPCVNPDGYIINEINKPNGGGLWRKNGRKSQDGGLEGVDLNRNYGKFWGYDNDGSSPNPNSDTYRGTSAFSEPETSAIREFCIQHNFLMALNYHTFGNLLVHPWGYNDLPTDEDDLFKAIGNNLNFENNFKMGTGSETVGYTVNGDADDYMYGDQLEKNKIFSYTPEVGPSFWPPKADIDYLNKSCVHMNLSLPRLALGYVNHKYLINPMPLQMKDTINIEFIKAGFGSQPIEVMVQLDPKYSIDAVSQSMTLKQMESMVIKFPYLINEDLLEVGKNDIQLFIFKNYGVFTSKDSITLHIYKGDQQLKFEDAGNTFNNWTSVGGNWGLSSLSYTSSPTSISDSPTTNYARGKRTTLEMFKGVDLTEGKSPILRFNIKYNIEKNFDYASVYAFSLEGEEVRLCGNYTRLGSKDQLPGEPIYDGLQEDWVTEEISLSQFEGQKDVFINFEMVADEFLEMDGVYIDDIQIIIYKPSEVIINTTENSENSTDIYPNPSNGIISLNGFLNGSYELFTLDQKMIQKGLYLQNKNLDFSFLNNGVYFLHLKDGKHNNTTTKKIVILK